MSIKFFHCACSERDGVRLTSCYAHRDDLSPRNPAAEVAVNFVEPPFVRDLNGPWDPDPAVGAARRICAIIAGKNSSDPERKAHAEALAAAHNVFP